MKAPRNSRLDEKRGVEMKKKRTTKKRKVEVLDNKKKDLRAEVYLQFQEQPKDQQGVKLHLVLVVADWGKTI